MGYSDCTDVWDETDEGGGNPRFGSVPALLLVYVTCFSVVLVSAPSARNDALSVTILAFQAVGVGLYTRSLFPGGVEWELPHYVTDPIARRVLGFFRRVEFADPYRVPRFEPRGEAGDEAPWRNTRQDVETAFRRMFNFRSRWVLLVSAVLVNAYIYDRGFAPLVLDSGQYGLALNFLGAVALAVSVLRGPAGIARDTVDVLSAPPDGRAQRHFCETLLASSANTIDGILGTTSLLLGFGLQLAHSFGS